MTVARKSICVLPVALVYLTDQSATGLKTCLIQVFSYQFGHFCYMQITCMRQKLDNMFTNIFQVPITGIRLSASFCLVCIYPNKMYTHKKV